MIPAEQSSPQKSEVVKKMGAATMTKTEKASNKKIREMPMKKESRVSNIQKNNQIKNSFMGVPNTDMRAIVNRSTWIPAMKMQQPRLGTSHLMLDNSQVRILQNLRTSWITTVMPSFGGVTVAQLYRMVEFMNPGRNVYVMILTGTNNVLRSSDSESHCEAMLVCLLTAVSIKFQCAALTVCTIAMSSRTQSSTGRRHNETVVRWNNIVRNLASRNGG